MHVTQGLRTLWLAVLAAVFVFAEWCIVHSSIFSIDGPLPWAVAFDLLIILPGAYALVVLRPAARPLTDLQPFALLCVLGAHVLLADVAPLRKPLAVLTAAAELLAIGIFTRRACTWRSLRGSADAPVDLVAQVSSWRHPLGRIVGGELCVLYYACIAPFRKAAHSIPAAETLHFHNGLRPRQLLLALGVLSVLEAVPLHMLLHARHPHFAWFALALSVYGLVWIAGAHRAFAMRPVVVSKTLLWIRASLFFTAQVELANIRGASLCNDAEHPAGTVVVAPLATPNVLIQLREPARVYGLFGRERMADAIALYVDQPGELLAVLQDETPARGLQ